MIEPIVRINGYFLQDRDDAAFPKYYGYTNEVGEWYIIREGSDASVRYARAIISTRGTYAERWNSRTGLDYDYWWSSF